MDIQTAIDELERGLSNTREFMALKTTCAEISQNPKNRQLIAQFHQRQSTLYESNMSQRAMQALAEDLNREYESLSEIPAIKRYFMAADDFNALLSRVMRQINSDLDQIIYSGAGI